MAYRRFRWLDSTKEGRNYKVLPFTTRKRKSKSTNMYTDNVIYLDFKTRTIYTSHQIQQDPQIQVRKPSLWDFVVIVICCVLFGPGLSIK